MLCYVLPITDKENKSAKNQGLFGHFALFYFFKLWLGYELDSE